MERWPRSRVYTLKTVWIHCLKEPNYVTKITSTHGTHSLSNVTAHRTVRPVNGHATVKTFLLPDIFCRFNKAKHCVDNNNNRRHSPISYETTWATKWWPHRQNAFGDAMAEVNAIHTKARSRNLDDAEATLVFRRALAFQMMSNTIGREDPTTRIVPERAVNAVLTQHRHCTKPPNAGIWENGRWTQVKKKVWRIEVQNLYQEVQTLLCM